MVGNDYTMKITDFGLSRQLYDDPAYVQLEQGKVPLRWMAIEAISERKYTFYSDVYVSISAKSITKLIFLFEKQ